jgi:hypothetical protein
MLLRIDDIVSGITKKDKSGPTSRGPQADDGDNVRPLLPVAPALLLPPVPSGWIMHALRALAHSRMAPRAAPVSRAWHCRAPLAFLVTAIAIGLGFSSQGVRALASTGAVPLIAELAGSEVASALSLGWAP